MVEKNQLLMKYIEGVKKKNAIALCRFLRLFDVLFKRGFLQEALPAGSEKS